MGIFARRSRAKIQTMAPVDQTRLICGLTIPEKLPCVLKFSGLEFWQVFVVFQNTVPEN